MNRYRLGAIVIFLEVITVSCSSIDLEKFEEVRRAAKEIEVSLATGDVNFLELRKLAKDSVIEASLLADSVSSESERLLATAYSEAISAYHDLSLFWGAQIREEHDSITVALTPELEPIIKKYGFKKVGNRFVFTDEELREVLTIANEQLQEANELYRSLVNP